MGWGEAQSVSAQLGAVRTQLDMAERKLAAAERQRDAWKALAEAHEAAIAAAYGTDAQCDAACDRIVDARRAVDALEP